MFNFICPAHLQFWILQICIHMTCKESLEDGFLELAQLAGMPHISRAVLVNIPHITDFLWQVIFIYVPVHDNFFSLTEGLWDDYVSQRLAVFEHPLGHSSETKNPVMLITLALSPKFCSFLDVELEPVALHGVFSSTEKHKKYLWVNGLKFLNTPSLWTPKLPEQEP